MKNEYKVCGDTTIIYINRLSGEVMECLISTTDLEKVSSISGTWIASYSQTNQKYYVYTWTQDKETKRKHKMYLHRFLLDAPKHLYVDHINHDPMDNRRDNLRLVTPYENLANKSGPYKNSKSGIRGVFRYKDKWVAKLTVNGKSKRLGFFDDIREAELVAIKARIEHLPGYIPPKEYEYLL